MNNDEAHFNADGYRLLGQRYANTMLRLLDDENTADEKDFSISTTVYSDTTPGSFDVSLAYANENIGRTAIYIDGDLLAENQTLFSAQHMPGGTHTVYAIAYDTLTNEYLHDQHDVVIKGNAHADNPAAEEAFHGDYAVYDLRGQYIGNTFVNNGRTGLKRGTYLLRSTKTNKYRKVQVTE